MTSKERHNQVSEILNSGKYITPARKRELLKNLSADSTSEEYQLVQWDKLVRSINGAINRVSIHNIKGIIIELFQLNLLRGRGVLVKSVLKSQTAAPAFTNVYSSLIAVLNSKIPEIGKLLIERLIVQFQNSFLNNEKAKCFAAVTFIAHLVVQNVAHEIIALQLMFLLLENPTDDSLDIACTLMTEVGAYLEENAVSATYSIFERIRNVLQEGLVSKKTQYKIEILLKLRRNKFEGHSGILKELDLVEDEDQITHTIGLDDKCDEELNLNVFHYERNYDELDEKYNLIKLQILGDDDEDEVDSSSDSDEEEEEEEGEEQEEVEQKQEQDEERKDQNTIKNQLTDLTAANLVEFQKNVYLTMMSSMSADEAVHKLLKLPAVSDKSPELQLINIIVKGCAQEKTYSKFYGLVGEKLCSYSNIWHKSFKEAFKNSYHTLSELELKHIRNVGKFWGHLFASDRLGWEIWEIVTLTESETTPFSRVFLKFLFQELVGELGVKKVQERLHEDYIQPYIRGIFPTSDQEHLRFSINFFTSIGLGVLTEEMRIILQTTPQEIELGHRSPSPSNSKRLKI
ncbi:Spliceosome assembly factor [Komagataella phaffii CBS 7435]|uniref:Pre-mRNA-splicing factor CWC22 n=2 Tax=Komagataella phaffii TaxID=460519 RepID=C4QY63_KOMPG|nr:Essential protein [Komagataella phaffii GS115]AOA60983.1 GQ67_01825T0 [Komagataella phaffii]CAH2447006.1 Spliceosome assembly factor [Komagataella phaffii CBS 7435]AOA66801.1 GQ68_01841T0 [Komagataella phaffii GS115]CAY68186.1 Essential protein [Komagataella phaffii GS115]CCA37259.1 Spliceosome assembly factor [Komagataella phaffii CBS 7435]